MKVQFSKRILKSKKSFIREILKVSNAPGVISFAGGLPNPLSFPVEKIRDAACKVLEKDGKSVLQYATTEGHLPLREFIANRYKKRFGLDISPDEILITNGSQQGLDLVGKVFLEPGDDIVIERPGYLGAIQSLAIFEPKFHGVNMNDDGVDIQELEEILKKHNPKFFYAVPNFQNPSGITYTDEVRKKVAELVKKYNTVFIEDDPYGELRFMGDDRQSMKVIAEDNVILLGSFSKIISPGMRMGWICAKPELMEKLIIAKQATDLHSNSFTQRILYQYLEDNDIYEHIEKIKALYKKQRNHMVKMIDEYFPKCIVFTKPEGGMFLWGKLPEGVKASDVFDAALEKKVAFVPGKPFYANETDERTFRLNYSNCDMEKIEVGMKKLAEVMHSFCKGI